MARRGAASVALAASVAKAGKMSGRRVNFKWRILACRLILDCGHPMGILKFYFKDGHDPSLIRGFKRCTLVSHLLWSDCRQRDDSYLARITLLVAVVLNSITFIAFDLSRMIVNIVRMSRVIVLQTHLGFTDRSGFFQIVAEAPASMYSATSTEMRAWRACPSQIWKKQKSSSHRDMCSPSTHFCIIFFINVFFGGTPWIMQGLIVHGRGIPKRISGTF